MRQMATFSVLEVQFFQRVCFSGGMFFFSGPGPSPGPTIRQCPALNGHSTKQ